MKIALVTHNVVRNDGQGRVNFELAAGALRKGHQVTIVSHLLNKELLDLGVRWEKVNITFSRPVIAKVMQFAPAADKVVKRLRSEADVIIANGYTLSVPHDLNICHFVHGGWLHSSQHPWHVVRGLWSWYQQLYTRYNASRERVAYAAADQVVAVSHRTAGELRAIGVPAGNITVIHNGVDLNEFHPGQAPRGPLGLPEDVPLALFAGDIRTNLKNLDSVLQAMVQVPELHLAVAGRLNSSPFPHLARTLGIANRVHFLDFRRDLPALMRASDLFVFPSRSDSFGLVVVEAMASGLPIVTAITTGASDVVTRESGIVLDNPEDVAALAVALRRYTDDPDLRQSAGRAARAIAEQHSWQQMAERYLNLMQVAVHSPSGGACA